MLRIVCGTIRFSYAAQFGRRLRKLREQAGFSQEALAEAAKLHRTHISLIERGQRSVRIETIARLATALSIQPVRLMPDLPRRRP
jgi:transcriptional regulator with XRE-family HTH domain